MVTFLRVLTGDVPRGECELWRICCGWHPIERFPVAGSSILALNGEATTLLRRTTGRQTMISRVININKWM